MNRALLSNIFYAVSKRTVAMRYQTTMSLQKNSCLITHSNCSFWNSIKNVWQECTIHRYSYWSVQGWLITWLISSQTWRRYEARGTCSFTSYKFYLSILLEYLLFGIYTCFRRRTHMSTLILLYYLSSGIRLNSRALDTSPCWTIRREYCADTGLVKGCRASPDHYPRWALRRAPVSHPG